ncbi:Protein CBG17112 [Caenorhabditis briggsae]|uniref:Protein CBG17112 n=1 Tax=Caenorhabditis briggsae TaxID=6238 RepID=A8XQQ4_CAEBR|nr:Protein CBG17112 [Caenorhabditis briggsae]CAP34979.2 Protein CBG17112 [Caenorhabditis briggsae]
MLIYPLLIAKGFGNNCPVQRHISEAGANHIQITEIINAYNLAPGIEAMTGFSVESSHPTYSKNKAFAGVYGHVKVDGNNAAQM